MVQAAEEAQVQSVLTVHLHQVEMAVVHLILA
jgi:hypothetical protein